MDKGGDMMGGPAANNSSDFVRKLYKMLEDPSHDSIVRWGEGGQSFVVLENEKFTKLILPKHFKHSNFASFVRQLNKYDFHKVRQNNEDNTPSPYGPNAWEFRHPEFQADKKDSLDNIRRKAPAPRKQPQGLEETGYSTQAAQQIELLNGQLVAYQHQLQSMSDRYQDLAQGHVVLLQQVVQLQKFVKAHDGVMHKVMGFLHNVDNTQRRNSRLAGPYANNGGPNMMGGPSGADIEDHPASPLQQASELLDKFSADTLPSMELAKMADDFHQRNEYSTPPNDQPTSTLAPSSNPTSATAPMYPGNNDLDNMVYPVGHTNGIDPVDSEHINNIPYALPPNGMLHAEPIPEMIPESDGPGRKKGAIDSPWGVLKPRILLVEDDKLCARIGSKFLQAFECGVETARDGLEAVSKINNGTTQFDLVLMDIIMPHLDGVSATVCIREIRPQLPIIAMTSNIRLDDIDMYFRYGMNDVLPKPFTKEGMLRALEKNLPHFKKEATFPGQPMAQPGAFVAPGQTQAPLNLTMAGQLSAPQSMKDETSPGKSPVTASSWHSPNQMPTTSPVTNVPGNYGPYSMGPSHPQQHPHVSHPQSNYQPPNSTMGASAPRAGPHRRVISDMTGAPGPDDHPDHKRQRMYQAPPGAF
ncbi:HSF-type DNA-binding protein [Phlyctema vagabunda]|uniref:Transcription factor n=1 Tax=Phlyctema vagabunda TaxID=108571 RepID=A0ABR4PSY9_9HELO